MPVSPSIFEFVAHDDIPVRVVRSTKRRKTISSQWRDETLIIQVPAALDEKTERSFVDEMLKNSGKVDNDEMPGIPTPS